MPKLIYCTLIGIILIGCSKTNDATMGQNENSEIEAFLVDYYNVMSRRDWPAYRKFFTDQAVLTTVWQDANDAKPSLATYSISEFLSQTASGPDSQPIFEEKPLRIEITFKNNLASAWVYYEARFGNTDQLVEWRGYDLFSLINYENQWYITSLTYISVD